jgi:hypothetical protein
MEHLDNNSHRRTQLMSNPSDQLEERVKWNFFTFTRSSIVSLAIIALILNGIYGFALPNGNINCILDQTFELTSGLNTFFADNMKARHVLIALSSLCVDFVLLYLMIHWALYGKSWRPFLCLIVFYLFRGLTQVSNYY